MWYEGPLSTEAAWPKSGWRSLCLLGVLSLLVGCGGDGSDATGSGSPGGGGDGSATSEETCETQEAFFEDRLWASVVGPYCVTCHTDGGLAAQSNFVLERSVRPDYLEINRERMADLARLVRDGDSLLLLKPQGELNHGGGTVLQPGSVELETLREFVERLDEEETCEEPPVAKLWDGVILEPPHLTVRRAALLLLGRLPTQEELEPVRESGEEGLAEALERLLDDDAFAERVAEMYRDVLWTDHLVGGNRANNAIDGTNFPNRRWYDEIPQDDGRNTYRSRTNYALARQPVELVRHVVAERLPFSEILTADYLMVNDYSAVTLGLSDRIPDLDDPSSEVFRPESLRAQPVTGLVGTPAFLNRYPSTNTNRNRHRAFVFYDRFLATDILALADRPIDPTLTEAHNPTLNDYQCTNCHTVMDPVAGLFQNWSNVGLHRPPEEGWHPDLAPPGFEGQALPSSRREDALRWLAERTVEDPRFAQATVNTVVQGLFGREAVRTVDGAQTQEGALERQIYRLQRSTLLPIAEAFHEGGFDIRQVVRDLLLTPYFRATGVTEEASAAAVASAGRRELLSPDDLNRRLTAVTGYPWRRNLSSADHLLSNFRLLYGGLDYDVSLTRLMDPNGIMVAIAERMALQHACRVVPRDFAKAIGERILMPHVERSYVPTTPEGFDIPQAREAIRENIRHLHAHLLGEELPIDDPEIDATLELFEEIWERGAADRRADDVPRDLPGACRATSDFWTGEDLEDDARVVADEAYTVRAWIAVVGYLLADYRFLYD